MVLTAAAPARNWLVLCEARDDTDANGKIEVTVGAHGELAGDELVPYLIRDDGRETRISQFIGADPTGRHVAYRIDDKLWLEDTRADRRVDLSKLGADLNDDAQSFMPHRAVSFGPYGLRIAYLRSGNDSNEVVLRDLRTGAQEGIEVGSQLIGRIAFERDGHFIRLDVVPRDSNGNGRVQWPFPPAEDKRGPCVGPVPSFNVWQWPGDDAETQLLDIATGQVKKPRGFVATLGSAIITREENTELWLEQANGERVRISSDKCNGRLLHADAENGSVFFGCSGAYGARRKLYARTRTRRMSLGFDVAAFELDTSFSGRPAWLALYPRNDTVLVSTRDGTAHRLATETRVLATYEDTALTEHGGELSFVHLEDADGKGSLIEEALHQKRPKLAHLSSHDNYALVETLLFDLNTKRYVGKFEIFPLAVSQDGLGLVPERGGDANTLAHAPVRWVKPEK